MASVETEPKNIPDPDRLPSGESKAPGGAGDRHPAEPVAGSAIGSGSASAGFSPQVASWSGVIPATIEERPMMDLLRILLAILLPPLGVFLQVGIGPQFWINILLTLLGYIPGIVHAVWIIARR